MAIPTIPPFVFPPSFSLQDMPRQGLGRCQTPPRCPQSPPWGRPWLAASGKLSTKGPQPAVQGAPASPPSVYTMVRKTQLLYYCLVEKLLSLESRWLKCLAGRPIPRQPTPNATPGSHKSPTYAPGWTAMHEWPQSWCASQRKPHSSGPTILHAAHAYEGVNWVAYDH